MHDRPAGVDVHAAGRGRRRQAGSPPPSGRPGRRRRRPTRSAGAPASPPRSPSRTPGSPVRAKLQREGSFSGAPPVRRDHRHDLVHATKAKLGFANMRRDALHGKLLAVHTLRAHTTWPALRVDGDACEVDARWNAARSRRRAAAAAGIAPSVRSGARRLAHHTQVECYARLLSARPSTLTRLWRYWWLSSTPRSRRHRSRSLASRRSSKRKQAKEACAESDGVLRFSGRPSRTLRRVRRSCRRRGRRGQSAYAFRRRLAPRRAISRSMAADAARAARLTGCQTRRAERWRVATAQVAPRHVAAHLPHVRRPRTAAKGGGGDEGRRRRRRRRGGGRGRGRWGATAARATAATRRRGPPPRG